MVFPPIWGGKNGGVLSMRMQVILDSLDSSFARLGSAPIECVRCHTIKNKIKNHVTDKVKKL